MMLLIFYESQKDIYNVSKFQSNPYKVVKPTTLLYEVKNEKDV